VCWSGTTEGSYGRRADVTKILSDESGLRRPGRVVLLNTKKWEAPAGPPEGVVPAGKWTSRHYYRQHWYWHGEAHTRTEGKLELTTIPQMRGRSWEDAATQFWDKIGRQRAPGVAKVVEILRKYNDTMIKAGAPYRY